MFFVRIAPHPHFGRQTLNPNQVEIVDNTLRDGNQMVGVGMPVAEKVAVAQQLVTLHPDIMEVGFPGASKDEDESVRQIANYFQQLARQGQRPPVLATFALTIPQQIDTAINAATEAPKLMLHVVGKASDSHLSTMTALTGSTLQEKRQQNLDLIEQTVAYACQKMKDAGRESDVQFAPEDATRCDFNYLVEVYKAAVRGGATALNVPDTVGFGTPESYGKLIAQLKATVNAPEGVIWTTHTHNDLGLAVANTLEGVKNGARRVEVSLGGIGERAGNASLEQVAVNLAIHPVKDTKTGQTLTTAIDLTRLRPVAQAVSAHTLVPVPTNAPVIGQHVFTTAAGIHLKAMQQNPTTYLPYDPSLIGAKPAGFLGPLAGGAYVNQRLREAGITPPAEDKQQAFLAAVKAQAYEARPNEVSDSQLTQIVQQL